MVAIDEMKYELVGKSTLIPGFANLICNLVTTTAVEEHHVINEDLYDW